MDENMMDFKTKEFIKAHRNDHPDKLRLAYYGKNLGFDVDFAITQIEVRKKNFVKFPFFINIEDFIFPDKSVAEQASNQFISLYHASLVGRNQSVADLTAGLGIDAFTLSLNDNIVTAFEKDAYRSVILATNANILHLNNFKVINADSIEWMIWNPDKHFDWIFIDPARRDMDDNRSFLLKDSSPDVVTSQQLIRDHADNILIKASPLLDVSKTISDFTNVKAIHIVSFKGECKETLIHITKNDERQDPIIKIIDIAPTEEYKLEAQDVTYDFSCLYSELGDKEIEYSDEDWPEEGMYVYELGAGMRKLNCSSLIQSRYCGLKSLIKNSFLFVSKILYTNFPGRISIIQQRLLDGKELKNKLINAKLRVVSSGYHLPADQIRKKYKIKEGSGHSVYFSRFATGKTVAFITKDL